MARSRRGAAGLAVLLIVVSWLAACDSGPTSRTLTGHEDSVNWVIFSADGRFLVSASDDKTIKVWDVAGGTLVRTLVGHADKVREIALSRDGRILASREEHAAKLWDFATGREIRSLSVADRTLNAIALSPDGRILAAADNDKDGKDIRIKLIDTESGKELRELTGLATVALRLAFSEDGASVSAIDQKDGIRIWQVADGKETAKLDGPNSDVLHSEAELSPDWRMLATTGAKTFELVTFDMTQRRELLHPEGHRPKAGASGTWIGVITGLAFSPDMKMLVSCATTGSLNSDFVGDIKLWSLKDGRLLRTLQHDEGAWFVAFSPDGKLLASAGDKTIKLWNVGGVRP